MSPLSRALVCASHKSGDMTVSAPSANGAVAPAAPEASDFAQTAALIKEIASEARTSGKTLVFDPDAPPDETDAGEPAEGAEDATAEPGEAKPDDAEPAEADESETEEATEDAPAPGSIDVEQIKRALAQKGGVDLVGLAKALGVQLEDLKLTPGQAKAIRIERRKTEKTLERATKLSTDLEQRYGDQVRARKAASEGDLQPAIDFIEATFGMGWNDLNKMIADLLQGKPVGDLDQRRELRELRKKEAERAEQAKKTAEDAKRTQDIAEAKTWIGANIKGDKLADPALNEQLKAAGMPTVVDMVFEELQANYHRGLTDPKKALERVKVKLERHAKALQSAGVLPKPKAAPKKSVTASPPRASAQTGSAGNGRDMSDAELRAAVLKEAGLYR